MYKLRLLFGSLAILTATSCLYADNQTPDVSPVVVGGQLPYQVIIEEAFTMPLGVHSFASGVYEGQGLILCGRTNGLHDFNNNNNNFPPSSQNTTVIVINTETGAVFTKSLTDPSSGLTQAQIDTLSVTSPQFFYDKDTLYISGGYGVDTASGTFSTKPVLSAIDMKGLIHWVVNASPNETAAQHIKQTTNEIFRVTGGFMRQSNKDLTLLMLGQNFQGYYLPDTNGVYTEQVRRFKIHNGSSSLSVHAKDSIPEEGNPVLRRRDLNIIPVIHHLYGTALPAYIAFSGVFTLTGGAWTVPVLIDYWGNPTMDDPASPTTFKQAMNNYACAFLGCYSKETKTMYSTLFGGISYGYFDNGVFTTDSELPFINQVTTIALEKTGVYTQYLMDNEFPVILSTGSNPGNQLLFGAAAKFFVANGIKTFKNDVVELDKLGVDPITVGYIVGGIMSTLPNTNTGSDSTASPYVFRVTLVPTP